MVQLVGDSLAEAKKQGLAHGWTGIIGNPAKFGLGLVSVSFDVSSCKCYTVFCRLDYVLF